MSAAFKPDINAKKGMVIDMAERDRERDQYYMSIALEEAAACAREGEVPVGAVIVQENTILTRRGNGREQERDATAHAELSAIRSACRMLGGWHLTGCELFVTLEPCPMCAGAIVNARLPWVIIGARDPKGGAFGSMMDLCSFPVNHKPQIAFGVMEAQCAAVLTAFFKERRAAGPRWSKKM